MNIMVNHGNFVYWKVNAIRWMQLCHTKKLITTLVVHTTMASINFIFMLQHILICCIMFFPILATDRSSTPGHERYGQCQTGIGFSMNPKVCHSELS